MNAIEQISTPIHNDFAATKELLRSVVASDYPTIGSIAKSLLASRGKLMRPLLVLLGAQLNGTISERTRVVGVLFELIHSATLIHDDIIDEAYTRHDQLTMSAMLRSRSAVIVGDFLFAKGLSVAAKAGAFDEIAIATQAIEALVEGELRQAHNTRTLRVDRAEYVEVCHLKTASLMAAAAKAGAASVGASAVEQQTMFDFGLKLGLAFQIQDDILDYTGSAATGKALYNDIKERKITLPLICAMERGGGAILRALRSGDTDRVVAFVHTEQGVADAQAMSLAIIDEAISLLNAYPDSPTKESAKQLTQFAIGRNK